MSISMDTYTYKVGNEDREVFMSYALLNKLAALIGNVESIGNLMVDMDLQAKALKLLVAEEDYEKLSKDTATKLLEWVADHIMGFMISSFETLQGMTSKYKDRTDKLQAAAAKASASSQAGSPA